MSLTAVQPREQGEKRAALSIETLAYLMIILIALGMRWIRLGDTPLGALEAEQAVAAWHTISADAPGQGVIRSPLTLAGMALSFAVASPTNAAARFVPMLGGLALALSPLLFRKYLGRGPALIASLLLAVSPGAVAASRQVTGVSFSMLGLILALAAFERYFTQQKRGWLAAAGAAMAIGLVADFGTPAGLLTILIGAGFMLLTDEEELFNLKALPAQLNSIPWRFFLIGLLVTILVTSTLLFLLPGGLAAAANQLGRFVNGLAYHIEGVPYLGLVLGTYELPLLVLGLTGAWLASQSVEPRLRLLAGWGIAGVAACLIYPGAQPEHALWAVVPLALLAGYLAWDLLAAEDPAPAWGVIVLVAAVLALSGMLFASLSRFLVAPRVLNFANDAATTGAQTGLSLDLILLILWIILLGIIWLTAASVWSTQTAWRGYGLGFLTLGLLVMAGQSAQMAFSRPGSPYEPLNLLPAQPGLSLLVDTAEEISELASGYEHDAAISIQASADGTLAWAMRDFNNLTYIEQVDPYVQSPMVITPADADYPALGSNYVGQDFVIIAQWTPAELPAREVIKWLLYREAATQPRQERVILWVREDIYRLSTRENVR